MIARIWLFTWVYSDVLLQITIFREGLRTLITMIWGFTWVYSEVYLQMTILREGLRTLTAMIWLFTQVFSQMYLQITIPREILLTDTAQKWLFSYVSPWVSVSFIYRSKFFFTVIERRGHSAVQNFWVCSSISTGKNVENFFAFLCLSTTSYVNFTT